MYSVITILFYLFTRLLILDKNYAICLHSTACCFRSNLVSEVSDLGSELVNSSRYFCINRFHDNTDIMLSQSLPFYRLSNKFYRNGIRKSFRNWVWAEFLQNRIGRMLLKRTRAEFVQSINQRLTIFDTKWEYIIYNLTWVILIKYCVNHRTFFSDTGLIWSLLNFDK